jgi:hypothetical protein
MNACLLIGRRETGFKKSYKKRQAASESSDQQRGFLFPLVEQRVSDAAHVVHHHRRAPRNGGRSFRIVVRPHATGTGHRDDRHLRGHEAHRVDVGRAGDAAGAGEADRGDGLLRRVSVGVVGEHGGDGAELRAHDTPPHSVPARPRHPAACTHTRPPAGKLPCAPALRPQRCPPAESSALPHHGHSPKCPARRRRRAVLTHAAAYHRDELLDCSAG